MRLFGIEPGYSAVRLEGCAAARRCAGDSAAARASAFRPEQPFGMTIRTKERERHQMRYLRIVMATGFLLGASLLAQTGQPVNIGPTPPPRVNADLSVTYFVNAPGAREVRLGDSVFAPEPPGIPLVKGSDGMWSV